MRKIKNIMIYVVGTEDGTKKCYLPAQVEVESKEEDADAVIGNAQLIVSKAIIAFLKGENWDG